MSNGTRVTIVLIMLLAAILRLSDLGLSEYKLDEADMILRAREVAEGRNFPSVGCRSSVGIPNPPLMVYLLALPSLFSRNPIYAIAAIASLNTLAVWATYLFLKRFFDERTALAGALLFAVNPWAILYGRKIWTQMLPLLTVGAFYLLFAVIENREKAEASPSASLFLFPSLGLVSLTYIMAPLFYVPIFMLALLVFRPLNRRHLMLGLGIFALVVAPYIVHLLLRSPEVGRAALESLRAGPAVLDAQALRLSLWFASGFNIEALLGKSASYFANYAHLLRGVHYIVSTLIFAGIGYSIYVIMKRKSGYERHVLLLLWFGLPIALMSWHSRPIGLHYFNVLSPVPLLFAAVAFGKLLSTSKRYLVWSALLLLVGVSLAQGISVWQLYRYLDARDARGAFGVPLKHWQRAAQLAKGQAQALSTREVHLLTKGTNPYYAVEPAIFASLLEPELTPRFLDRKGGHYPLLLPVGREALYILPPTSVPIHRAMERFGEEIEELTLPGGKASIRLYLVRERTFEEIAALPQHAKNASYGNGVRLLGYDAPEVLKPGEELSLTLYLAFEAVEGEERGEQYMVFNHFVDGEDKLWAQRDGFGWPTRNWRNGEVAIAWYNMSIPKGAPRGEYAILTGMYNLKDGQRAPILDEAGRVGGNFVRLCCISVEGEG